MAEETFYLIVGIAVVGLILLLPIYFALRHFFGIDMRTEFYASQAEFTGLWYDRKEQREAAARGRLPSERYPAKRKD